MKLSTWLKGALVGLVVGLSLNALAASKDVSVSISVDKRALEAHEDVMVNVTMTNVSDTAQYVLKWHTPFLDVEESLFQVQRDGKPLHYLGEHYKRQAPKAADYLKIQPGKSHTQKVELSSLYDMSVTGDYTIRYHTSSFQLFARDFDAKGAPLAETEVGALDSDIVSVWINGRLPRGTDTSFKGVESAAPQTAGLTYNKCTASQQADIASALTAAQSMANDGNSYLQTSQTGARYTTWFGAYDAARYTNMKAHFTAIKDAIDSKPINVDCGCKKTYYAYVYPTQPYTVYVCKAFWSAPMTGTDSKGGTLIHELSHFNVVASTDDWVYGQAGAKNLALTDPAKATDNADSHEYFAENTPNQR